MMKKYEGMFIIKPDLEKDSKKKIIDLISNTITKEGGKVKDLNEWGKNRLAYKIKRCNEGLYILAHFTLPADNFSKMEKVYSLNEGILKFMIIVDEIDPSPQQDKAGVSGCLPGGETVASEEILTKKGENFNGQLK